VRRRLQYAYRLKGDERIKSRSWGKRGGVSGQDLREFWFTRGGKVAVP
jgi:hypothetical protein